MNRIFLSIVSFCLIGSVCFGAEKKNDKGLGWYIKQYPYFTGSEILHTFESELKWPEGFNRPEEKKLTPFQIWVSNIPLWDDGKSVYSASMGTAFKRDQITRSVRFPWRTGLFREYVIPIQLVADYKYWTGRQNDLAFVTKLGDTLTYKKFLESTIAYNPYMHVMYQPSEKREPSETEFNAYFNLYAFNANYASLENNCIQIDSSDLMPGDIYLGRDSAGNTGKVYVIMLVVTNEAGEKRYVVGTGCGEPCDLYLPLFHDDRANPWLTDGELNALIRGWHTIEFLRPVIPGKK